MTGDELDRLAALIADALRRETLTGPRQSSARPSWVPAPVRPEPPGRGGEPAPWTGAGQALGDLAPIRHPVASRHRADVADLTVATRSAAAGKGAPPDGTAAAAGMPSRRRRSRALPVAVRVGVSRRHLHLSPEHARTLFGSADLTVARPIRQPGQFAAAETVSIEGPGGRIEGVRVVGPPRGETQLELSLADARAVGVTPPVTASGVLGNSIGGVTLVGPHGRVALTRGVIVAARHLHLSTSDAVKWGLNDGDLLDVSCGVGARAVTLHDVLVRSGDRHATEVHLDDDEARACGVRTGDEARIVAVRGIRSRRRPLVTERDVLRLAREGGQVPAGAILTPSARDRARALGLVDS